MKGYFLMWFRGDWKQCFDESKMFLHIKVTRINWRNNNLINYWQLGSSLTNARPLQSHLNLLHYRSSSAFSVVSIIIGWITAIIPIRLIYSKTISSRLIESKLLAKSLRILLTGKYIGIGGRSGRLISVLRTTKAQ